MYNLAAKYVLYKKSMLQQKIVNIRALCTFSSIHPHYPSFEKVEFLQDHANENEKQEESSCSIVYTLLVKFVNLIHGINQKRIFSIHLNCQLLESERKLFLQIPNFVHIQILIEYHDAKDESLTLDPKACNFNIVSTVNSPVKRAFIQCRDSRYGSGAPQY